MEMSQIIELQSDSGWRNWWNRIKCWFTECKFKDFDYRMDWQERLGDQGWVRKTQEVDLEKCACCGAIPEQKVTFSVCAVEEKTTLVTNVSLTKGSKPLDEEENWNEYWRKN